MAQNTDNLFGKPLPRLGFGCMRLPEGQDGEYIEEEIAEMFDYAMCHVSRHQLL